jgi:acyl-CoA reductase-like NAD-dependent aldehyde dehydrogenase
MPALPHTRVNETALPVAEVLEQARAAQAAWATRSVRERLQILRRFRSELAAEAFALSATIPVAYTGSLHRTEADSLASEVLPLAEACRFLEREARFVLAPRKESNSNQAFWLRSVDVWVERVPLGVVLLIAPGNYPLFLAGAQALQALAAGNAVLWKPAPAGVACAHAMRVMLIASGLPPELLTVLDAAPTAATACIAEGVDKVFLTGSAKTGDAVLHTLAEKATPAVMELSGCDAVFVLEGANLARVVDALTFGLRLNGSATCMAPRRVFVARAVADKLAIALHSALAALPPVRLTASTAAQLSECLEDARRNGAQVLLDGLAAAAEAGMSHAAGERIAGSAFAGASLVVDATSTMQITRSDLFAPVLSVIAFRTVSMAIAMHRDCPYALTAAIFGPDKEARAVASQLDVGTVILQDIIVPTADPRVPFGGRKRSGFGVTRGREGLLEMTAPRAIVRQRSSSSVPYKPTSSAHSAFFAGYIQAAHAQGWRKRFEGFRAMAAAMPGLGKQK